MISTHSSFEETDWESIGFQNKERIETDFRATGVLGILNILYLIDVRSTSYNEIKKIYELSCDSKQGYPLMLALFTLTKATMDKIREDSIEWLDVKLF